MPTTTTCPSCHGQLRVPDDLLGKQVRCPVCQNVFEAAAPAPAPGADAPGPPAPERPLWKDLSLELDKSDPNGETQAPAPESAPAPARKRGLVGAVELTPSGGEEPAAPPRPSAPTPPRRPDAPPGPRRRQDDDEDDDYGPRRGPYGRGPLRRDTEPHRGVLILVLGIISLAAVILTCFYVGPLIGIPLGITAWVLGHGDLRKIKNNQMDPEGLGITQAGWICGIIGTILNSLVLLSCGGFIVFMLTMGAASQTSAPKPGFAQPPPPAIGK